MAIRLITIDLDGTTLTTGRVPHSDTQAAVARATELGLCVVPASGRLSTTMWPHVEKIGTRGPIICCNGALILDENKKVLRSRPVPKKALEIVGKYAIDQGVHVSVYTLTEMHFLTDTPYGRTYVSRTAQLRPEVKSVKALEHEPLFKILVVDDPEKIPLHRKNLSELLTEIDIRMTESEPEFLEILEGSVSKGTALQFLANHLNIKQEETAAIGDYLNDVEMVQWAEVGGAVANAHEELKAVATILAPSNDDGGAAWFIDYICTNRQE